ncbi:hypothetical protein LTR41_010935 [Exophiala xenobiotica]|nr:hypothetical protein LTR41_010935 [Exophiala xenobiotica]
MGRPLSNLKPFDNNFSEAKPDVDTTRPAAPNFFVEGKSSQGRVEVAKRKVKHHGAFGAQAMHELQNYGAAEPEYDNKARRFTAAYHAGTSTLQTYATHITAPLTPGGEPECRTTETKGFDLTNDRETFVQGATTYRNSRDLAKTKRDRTIDHANQVAGRISASSPNKLHDQLHIPFDGSYCRIGHL